MSLKSKKEELDYQITKRDLIKYFEAPEVFWFKSHQEINELLATFCTTKNDLEKIDDDEDLDESDALFEKLLEHENFEKIMQFSETVFDNSSKKISPQMQELINLIGNEDLTILKNQFLIYKQINFFLKKYIAKIFNKVLPINFYDHSNYFSKQIDSHIKCLELIKEKKNFIVFRPKIIYQKFKLDPTFLIKYQQKIYLIEFKISSRQKQKNILDFIFYEKILQESNYFHVDCYLNCLIQGLPTNDHKNFENFILSPFIPFQKKASVDNVFERYVKKIIQIQLASAKLANEVNVFFDPKKEHYDFVFGGDGWGGEGIWEAISYLKACRPILFSCPYEFRNKKGKIILKDFVPKNEMLNINNFFGKQLQPKDYCFPFFENEVEQNYNSFNQISYSDALKNGCFSDYAKIYNLFGEKINKLRFLSRLQMLKIITYILYDELAFQFDFLIDEKSKSITNSNLLNFFQFFDQLNYYRSEKKLNVDSNFFKQNFNSKNPFKNSTYWKQILSVIYPNLKLSGSVASLSKLHKSLSLIREKYVSDEQVIQKMFFEDDVFDTYGYNKKWLINEEAIAIFNKFIKIPNKIYYDFESLCSPIPIMDNTKPYQQIVNQISIIKDINQAGIENCINLVFDPQKLDITVFKQIIDLIYVSENKNNVYVVYNKSFENSRLHEMVMLINEPKYFIKVRNIINNTFDLADFFAWNKRNLVHKDLKGFYSIKKVIDLVPENLLTKAKAVNYYKLEKVQNGMICQNLAIERFLEKNITHAKNIQWEKNAKLMKLYCENDVRSMIAVQYLIEETILNCQKKQQFCSKKIIKKLFDELKKQQTF